MSIEIDDLNVGLDELTAPDAAHWEQDTPSTGRRTRTRLWIMASGGALATLAVLALLILHFRDRQSTDDAQVDGHIVTIAPKISGNVAEVLVTDNQEVKAGQVLVKIDARDYQARVDQAQASLDLAMSQARAAETGVPLTAETTLSGTAGAEAQVANAEAEYERARLAFEQANTAGLAYAMANVEKQKATFDRARADLERMKPLVAKAEISQLQFDSFVAAARVAESELRADQEKLAQATRESDIRKAAMLAAEAQVHKDRAMLAQTRAQRKQVSIRSAEASSAQAAVALARANLEAAQLQLSYATIAAPIDGVVTRKTVEVGQYVQPGQAQMVLIPLREVWVTANFKETQLAKVRPGQAAEVKVDMYGRTFSGHVDSLAGSTGARLSLLPPENATGNFVKVVERIPVKIVLDPVAPEQGVLRPGMNVAATIITR